MSISIPRDFISDAEEKALFKEIAGDIAFALQTFEVEQERKRAKEALRESEEKYRTLFEHATEAIYVAQDGKIKFPNPKTEELYGYSAEELTSKPFTYFIHEKDQNMVLERHKKRLRGEAPPSTYPFRIINKTGDTKWVEINVVAFSWDHRPATLCFLTDVTDRKRTEEALLKQTHDLGERVKEVNCLYSISKLLEKPDISLEKILQETAELIPPASQYPEITCARIILDGQEYKTEKFRETIWKMASDIMVHGKRIGTVEVYFLEEKPEKDKGPFLKEERNLIEAISQRSGKIIERKRVEEEKKKLQTQILQSEKMASIGQLAAGVAHEINNPTGFVSSNLKTLSDYQNDIFSLIREYSKLIADLKEAMATAEYPGSIPEQMDRIVALESKVDINYILDDIPNLIEESQEGTERIKRIVIDLKDFAHSGEQDPEYANINKNLDSTLNIVWNELKYKATVTKDYGELPEVLCYPQQLNQVFMNILVNAAQAIEKQGEIRIATRALDGQVEIAISDTGSGIPKENLSKIFDPFFTTREVGKGTGLGLNVAYNIIQKHKGTIEVESEVGKGTTFTVRIPVNEVPKVN